MFKLLCIEGHDIGKEFDVPDNKDITIGRSDTNDISINDIKSSRNHCRLRFVGGIVILEDLQSTNGVRINGEPVEDKIELKGGDRIGVGETEFILKEVVEKSVSMQSSDSYRPVDKAASIFEMTQTTTLRKMRTEKRGRCTGFVSVLELRG